jgi:hypothetical protein
MSGSNSSAPDAHATPTAPEALAFTVHQVAGPDLADPVQAQRRRTVSGRIKMLLVLAVCAAPVVASYFTYFVIRPEGRTNYSTLILPTRGVPDLQFRNLDGAPVPARSLRGQWLLLTVGPAACGTACEQRLYLQRQLRDMLGRERTRMDKVWLVTDDGTVPSPLRAGLQGPAPVTALRVDRAALAQWLQPAPGQALEDHLYLVDPMGEWMMRIPPTPEPGRVKRDLERVLRASSWWDTPGR